MLHYDASNSAVHVFTFKEGLLSPMAHDLKLAVTSFSIEFDGAAVRATFDAASLRVVTPMRNGVEKAGLLPPALYAEIEKNARNDVLNAARFPQVKFEGEASETELHGTLTLHGVSRPLRAPRLGNSVELKLDVRDFGIKPFTAMLGALKVKPELLVRFSAA